MSKFTNRPMSEYESACFQALIILFKVIRKPGGNDIDIVAELWKDAESAILDGSTNKAKCLNVLARIANGETDGLAVWR